MLYFIKMIFKNSYKALPVELFFDEILMKKENVYFTKIFFLVLKELNLLFFYLIFMIHINANKHG